MRVPGHDWLYAIGDINGRALFTHMGKYQARIAADHLLGHDHVLAHGADGPLSPRVIFTEPQVAAVGHTSESARAGGPDRRRLRDLDLGQRRAARFYGRNAPGTTRWIVDRERRIVVGCTITGAEIADFLHAATIAIVGEVPLERLRHAVPSFPTRSEIWLQAGRLRSKGRGGSRLRSLRVRLGASTWISLGRRAFHLMASLFASLTSASKEKFSATCRRTRASERVHSAISGEIAVTPHG